MKRILNHGSAVIRLNELQYTGDIVRAIINQGPETIESVRVEFLVNEIATVDEDGNVLSINKDGYVWGKPAKEFIDINMDETL